MEYIPPKKCKDCRFFSNTTFLDYCYLYKVTIANRAVRIAGVRNIYMGKPSWCKAGRVVVSER